jgi:hypothetical protein
MSPERVRTLLTMLAPTGDPACDESTYEWVVKQFVEAFQAQEEK